MSLQKFSKADFCRLYLSNIYQAVAIAVLPDGDRTLGEWQDLWARTLRSPA